MTIKWEALRDWPRLFGLLLNGFSSGPPFTVEVYRAFSNRRRNWRG